jgi:hypothetical protein
VNGGGGESPTHRRGSVVPSSVEATREQNQVGYLPPPGRRRRAACESMHGLPRVGSRLLHRVVLVALALALVGLIEFLPHVLHGGLYVDDWADLSFYRFAPSPRFANAVSIIHFNDPRPLLAYWKVAAVALFGQHGSYYLVLALLLSILVSLLLAVLLLRLGYGTVFSVAVAVLVLLFPWSDSVHLWSTASLNQIALSFYLAGLIVAVHGLSHRGVVAVGWHAAALSLFTLSMLTYEAAATLIPLSGLVYLAVYNWRTIRWVVLLDFLFGVALAVLTYRLHSHGRSRPGLTTALSDLSPTLHQLVGLGARAVDPVTDGATVVLTVIVVIALVRFVQLRRGGRMSAELWRNGLTVAFAALFTLIAVLPYAGSGGHPLDPGINNRGNIVVALPIVVGVIALVQVIASMWVRHNGARRAFVTLLLIVIGVSYAVHVRNDASHWDDATKIQHRVLTVARTLVPDPAPGSVVFVLGYPAMTAPGVPTFSQTWDLGPAVSVRYGRPIGGYPVFAGAQLQCVSSGVYPISPPGPYDALQGGEGPLLEVAYKRAFLIDIATSQLQRLSSQARCQDAARGLRPAPFTDSR